MSSTIPVVLDSSDVGKVAIFALALAQRPTNPLNLSIIGLRHLVMLHSSTCNRCAKKKLMARRPRKAYSC